MDEADRFGRIDKALERIEKRVEAGFREVDARFEQVDARFDQIDARFEQVDARFSQIDARFEQVDGRFGHVDTRLDDLKNEMHVLHEDALRRIADIADPIPFLDRRLTEIEAAIREDIGRQIDPLKLTVRDHSAALERLKPTRRR